MIKHKHKLVQLVKTSISTVQQLIDYNFREGCVSE